MLSLSPGSSCDVCAEEYGPLCLPHSIPCGHVLCRNCCKNIVEKTPSRLQTVCPFCREQFTTESVRLIRTDFTSSGYSTPRFVPGSGCDDELISDAFSRKAERVMNDGGHLRTRVEARRLEDKVAKVAAKKCSVEEVSTLHNELQEWLTSDPTYCEKLSSLHLSAALLRAILMNHFAHSEACKVAKSVEAKLKAKLDDMEIVNGKLDAETKNLRMKYDSKSQECHSLRSELSRLKALSTTLGTPTSSSSMSAANDARRATSVSPTPSSAAPSMMSASSSSHQNSQPAVTPLSRFNSTHSRSVSMTSNLRPITPSPASSRSYTPAPPSVTRTYTPAPTLRSKTPGPASHYPHHQSQQQHSHHPPMPPVTPTPASRTRRMSLSTAFGSSSAAPKITRSTSEEKAEVHERWTPPTRSASRHAIY